MLILASESPRRKSLVKGSRTEAENCSCGSREIPRPKEDPLLFSQRMAEEKADIVSSLYPEQWVLGADTVVVLGEKMLGKPKDSQEAKKFLRLLSGETHRVITGFCLKNRVLNRSLIQKRFNPGPFQILIHRRDRLVCPNRRAFGQSRCLCHSGKGGLLCEKDKRVLYQCGRSAGDGGIGGTGKSMPDFRWNKNV